MKLKSCRAINDGMVCGWFVALNRFTFGVSNGMDMSIWQCPLTDLRSARIRFVLSLAWSLPLLALGWFIQRSLSDVLIIASAFSFMSISELLLDLQSLKATERSVSFDKRWRGITAVAVTVAILVAVCLKG